MCVENPITKVTRILTRPDGSEARIVVTQMGLPTQLSNDVYVHRREHADAPWQLCSDLPHPDIKTMSRADYLAFGRSEVLRTVSVGEILSVSQLIGQPMNTLPH